VFPSVRESQQKILAYDANHSIELPYKICVMCENVGLGQITMAREDDGGWTVDGGRWTMDGGRWTMDGGRWTRDSRR